MKLLVLTVFNKDFELFGNESPTTSYIFEKNAEKFQVELFQQMKNANFNESYIKHSFKNVQKDLEQNKKSNVYDCFGEWALVAEWVDAYQECLEKESDAKINDRSGTVTTSKGSFDIFWDENYVLEELSTEAKEILYSLYEYIEVKISYDGNTDIYWLDIELDDGHYGCPEYQIQLK